MRLFFAFFLVLMAFFAGPAQAHFVGQGVCEGTCGPTAPPAAFGQVTDGVVHGHVRKVHAVKKRSHKRKIRRHHKQRRIKKHHGKRQARRVHGRSSYTQFCRDTLEKRRFGHRRKKVIVHRCVWVRDDLLHRYRGLGSIKRAW